MGQREDFDICSYIKSVVVAFESITVFLVLGFLSMTSAVDHNQKREDVTTYNSSMHLHSSAMVPSFLSAVGVFSRFIEALHSAFCIL